VFTCCGRQNLDVAAWSPSRLDQAFELVSHHLRAAYGEVQSRLTDDRSQYVVVVALLSLHPQFDTLLDLLA
jgi:hypothetical protein